MIAPSNQAQPAGPPPEGDAGDMGTEVARAGSWGFSGRAVLLVANLASTPFTIRLLGPSAYGLWALIQAVLLWAGLAEGGMWAATTKFGAARYAAGDSRGEATVVWTGLCFAFAATGSVALALSLGAHAVLEVLNVKGGLLSTATLALRIACLTFVLYAVQGSVNTVQQVRLRWRQFTILNTLSNLIVAIGVPLALYVLGGGVVTAASVCAFGTFVYVVGLFWDGQRVQPAIRRPHVSLRTLRQLISYGGALTVAGIASVPLSTGERFFLSSDTSTTKVAYYAVAMTIATTLLVLPEQICSPLIPALARLEAEGEHDEHRALYAKSLAGLFLVLTPATIIIALMARPFLSLWAGPAYGAHATILLLVALAGAWANALAWVPGAYILSSGRTKALALLQAAELPPYILAAWALTARWGAIGAAATWSGRFVVDAAGQFMIARRAGRLTVVPLSAQRARSVLAPAALGLACAAAALESHGLLARSAEAIVLMATYSSLVWTWVLTARERRGIVSLLGASIGSRFARMFHQPAHRREKKGRRKGYGR